MKTLFCILVLLMSSFAHAAGITYHGQILKPSGEAVQGQFVGFRIRIMDGNTGSCLMYEESHTKDMRNSNGAFAIQIGDGSVAGTYNVAGITYFDEIFRNSGTYNFTAPAGCAATPYTPDLRHGRKLKVDFRESPTDSWESMPTMEIAYVPYAFNSLVSKQVGDHTPASLLRVENAGTPSAASALTPANFTELLALLNGTTTQYVKTVSGTAGQVTVSTTSGAATIGLADVATVTAGTYGSATQVPVFTVDAKGRITGVTNTSITGGGGGGITQLTGDVTASGTGSVSATIANDAITTAKILDGNVTSAKLAASAVGSAQLAEGSVTSGKIADGGISTAKIADGAVTEIKIANGAVTANKIAADAVTSAKILNGSIIGDDISATASLNVASVSATGNIGGETMSSRLLALYEQSVNGTDYVGLKAPDNITTGLVVFTLPSADGTPGQVLRTDGSGNLSWVNAASGAGDFLANGSVPMTGSFLAANGSSSVPSISFASDIDTGFYRPAANSIGIVTNGAERARFSSTGFLGFNEPSPTAPIHVVIPSGYSEAAKFKGGPWNDSMVIIESSASGGHTGIGINIPTVVNYMIYANKDTNNLTFNLNSNMNSPAADSMILTSAGELGIGRTPASGRMLHVDGAVRLDPMTTPSSPAAGDVFVDSADSNKLKWYDGAAWQSAGGSGGGGGMTQLTGDVTASGTGSVAVTIAASAVTSAKIAEGTIVASDIADDAVTFAKIQNIASGGILGRGTAGSGNIEELTLGSGLTMTGTVLSATASDTFSGLPCGNGFVPYRSAGAWTCIEATASKTNSTLVSRDSSGNFVAGSATLETSLLLKDGAAGGAITISAPIAFTGYTLTMPASAGAAGHVLSTNGSGVLSWAAAGSGGGSGDFKADGSVAATDTLYLAQGALGTGGISFTGDTDTGIVRTVADVIDFVSGGNVICYINGQLDCTDIYSSTNVSANNSVLAGVSFDAATRGDATAPAFKFSSDGANGLFSPSANNLAVTTNSVERLRVTSSGAVAIGTTTPTALLTVNGTLKIGNGAETCPAVGAGGIRYNSGAVQFCNGTTWAAISSGSGDFMANGSVNMTAQFQAASGTASVPSISFDGDPNTGLFSASADVLGFSTGGSERLRITSSGSIGIGLTNPDVELDVNGSIEFTGTLTDVSDRRFKHDINPLDQALRKITSVDGVSFRMNDQPEVVEYGVIAQDVEKIFPDLVKTANDEMQRKSVNYLGFIAWIIEALKELNQKVFDSEIRQEQINHELEKEIEKRDQKIQDLESRLKEIERLLKSKSETQNGN